MLKPYFPVPVPPADVSYHLDISFQTISKDHVNMGYMNQTSWRPLMNDSTLFQSQRGISTFDATSPSSQLVIPLNTTNGVQLVLNNLDEGSHPFHFHGHVFHVLGWGHGNYQPGVTPLELVNPLRRDTITIPAYGWTVVRFVNDNPGMWAMHCHISWHSESGLMVQFESLPDRIRAMDIPAEMKAMCAASNTMKS
jgi:FtsP/CotA-like multicopper oxidase with cupredoxin domain